MTYARFSMPGRGAAAHSVAGFTTGWLFGGRCPEPDPAAAGPTDPEYDDSRFVPVTIPHTVCELGWLDWDPQDWSGRWIYRRHVEIPAELRTGRLFLGFEGALVGTEVWVNGLAKTSAR